MSLKKRVASQERSGEMMRISNLRQHNETEYGPNYPRCWHSAESKKMSGRRETDLESHWFVESLCISAAIQVRKTEIGRQHGGQVVTYAGPVTRLAGGL